MKFDPLIEFERLQAVTGYVKKDGVIRWLNEHQIEWWADKDGRPFTTIMQFEGSDSGEFEFGQKQI